MKTYDEALDMLNGPDTPAGRAALKDHAMRGVDVADEIANSDRTHELIWAIVGVFHGDKPCMECDTCKTDFSLAMTAYMNGVRVGMEMEKQ